MFDKQDDSGVSPVIGVILMVAVTVALVALVTVTVFDIGGDVSESPDATVQLEEDSGAVTATVLRNENVDDFTLQASDGSTVNLGGDAGATASLTSGGTQSATETFQVENIDDGSAPFAVGELVTLSNDIDSITSFRVDDSNDGSFNINRNGDLDASSGNADQAELLSSDVVENGGGASSNPEVQIQYEFTGSSFDSVNVIANMPDGNSEVLTSTEVNN